METPQTFYKKPADEEQPAPGIPFTVDPPNGEVVTDKVVEGIHKRLRDEGRPVVSMAKLCEFAGNDGGNNTTELARAFHSAKDLHIFLLTHGYLENFKEDAGKHLTIYELRYKYQTSYNIMASLATDLNVKFSTRRTGESFRQKLREKNGLSPVAGDPVKSKTTSALELRLERIESQLHQFEIIAARRTDQLDAIEQQLKTIASQVEYIHEFTYIKSYD